MEQDLGHRKKIPRDVAEHLATKGAPLPSFSQLAQGSDASRQLIRYYFDDVTDMKLAVCDHLAEAYRMALVSGVEGLDGPKRLSFILDFYFDLVEDNRKPRDDRAYDAMMAYAAGAPKVREALRDQYTLLGQVLALEIKMVHPHLSLEHCAEIAYLFVCLMYGHWKMVATLGLSEDHKYITRRAVDRIITLYAQEGSRPKDWPRPWTRAD
jgi:AcrR family transcriptional regulator